MRPKVLMLPYFLDRNSRDSRDAGSRHPGAGLSCVGWCGRLILSEMQGKPERLLVSQENKQQR